MSQDELFPISPATAAKRAREQYPNLAAFTKPSIDDDERAALYEAAMRGEHRPLGVQGWRRVDHELVCPGCGAQAPDQLSGSAFPCASCGLTRRVP